MIMNQETASIIRFILDAVGDARPYYRPAPEGYGLPSVYFPAPEVLGAGCTLSSYELAYVWKIEFSGADVQAAYEMAVSALEEIQRRRGRIPLLDIEGNGSGDCLSVNDPEIVRLENSARLVVSWSSYHNYADEAEELAAKFSYKFSATSYKNF